MLCAKKIIIYVVLCTAFYVSAEKTNLLIKIPTRSRPHKFFKTLDTYYQRLSFTVPYTFLISCDADDASMNNPVIIQRLTTYPHLVFKFGNNHAKVEAYNANIDEFDFDILIAASDDMVPMVDNFDAIILDNMKEAFPDLDGVLHFNDGSIGRPCNTLP